MKSKRSQTQTFNHRLRRKTMAKKKNIVSGNIAPLNTNCVAIHSMSFNEAERRLDVTLKTDNQLFPLQDFKFEWDEDEDENFYYSYQLCKDPKAPNGQDWWEFALDDDMPEPKNANDLTRQRKYIDKNLICHWGIIWDFQCLLHLSSREEAGEYMVNNIDTEAMLF